MAHDTLSQRRAVLEDEWARWVSRSSSGTRHGAPPAVRDEVADSWLRSARTVDPRQECAPDSGDVSARWAESPLREPVTALATQIRDIAEDAGFIGAVTDETGTILWSCGGQVMRRRAERVNFAPGGRWDEAHMGTNALSLALATGNASTVFSAEHLVAALHGWVCYCAPIRDADGRELGVLDLSSTWDRSHPLGLSMVRSLVCAIESRMHGAASSGQVAPRLSCLGAARLTRHGEPVRLRRRHLEILTLLALQPQGLTPERLQYAIYGERPVTTSTLKADVSQLRKATGGEIGNRVYRLLSPLSCDATEVLSALRSGDVATAVRLYRGPLLPDSETPGIVEWRHHLEVAVRTAVLSSADPELALQYGMRAPDDLEIHEHALRLLSATDPRRGVASARVHTALRR
ncbi:transcriptional regulator [Nocardia sp. 2]|uniref:Transcriptional regulator n=1 Tax=Nocardia acididurans TaxID=2802282 RepID=A0ABS1MI39_9NOCA|nr:helix-turn-helix domain-containing protein [Nocardia acididurans]MBL1080322.1 transcriptional regulator [Nocardia acididurans]